MPHVKKRDSCEDARTAPLSSFPKKPPGAHSQPGISILAAEARQHVTRGDTSCNNVLFPVPVRHQGSTAAAGHKNPEGNGASGHRVQHLSAVYLSFAGASSTDRQRRGDFGGRR